MRGDSDIDGLFEDAGHDPLWEQAGLMADAPPRPSRGYITVSLAWLARVMPAVRSAEQLGVAMVLYRRCLMARSQTVTLPNGGLAEIGIGRQTKYRALAWLREAGAITVEETENGRSLRVTLHWFP